MRNKLIKNTVKKVEAELRPIELSIRQLTLFANWGYPTKTHSTKKGFGKNNIRYKRYSSKTDSPTSAFSTKNSPRSHSPSCDSTNLKVSLVFIYSSLIFGSLSLAYNEVHLY